MGERISRSTFPQAQQLGCALGVASTLMMWTRGVGKWPRRPGGSPKVMAPRSASPIWASIGRWIRPRPLNPRIRRIEKNACDNDCRQNPSTARPVRAMLLQDPHLDFPPALPTLCLAIPKHPIAGPPTHMPRHYAADQPDICQPCEATIYWRAVLAKHTGELQQTTVPSQRKGTSLSIRGKLPHQHN